MDTAVIVGVVLIKALVGFIQEGRAEQAMRAIRSLPRLRAVVLRKGRVTEVDAAELVPGDIVILQAGDRVAADLRLLDSRHLEADLEDGVSLEEEGGLVRADLLEGVQAALGDPPREGRAELGAPEVPLGLLGAALCASQ